MPASDHVWCRRSARPGSPLHGADRKPSAAELHNACPSKGHGGMLARSRSAT
eukprot:CAMPEP_0195100558 /NCGR_PEP_ID=MMETSP0448-20130528/63805_1 /TAXON_ID=66468 /ORGANISM="Heterocapsa triquestra, Strain CCMP 448" /LENGTH=51 /DNA_ID=CAMNT_0040135739 /DNA_START=75 /DNA_END=226 /DNA_ORIENTATION=+